MLNSKGSKALQILKHKKRLSYSFAALAMKSTQGDLVVVSFSKGKNCFLDDVVGE